LLPVSNGFAFLPSIKATFKQIRIIIAGFKRGLRSELRLFLLLDTVT
jgi:hypothetical protein